MTGCEFAEYQSLYALHPFGPQADDVRAARLCATIANFSSAVDWKKRNKKAFQPADFLPAQPKPRQTTEQQLENVKRINRALGGIAKPKKG